LFVYSPGGSTGLMVWQLQSLAVWFGWELDPQISPFPQGQGPHLTGVTGPYKCTCQMVSKFVKWFKQGAQM